MQHGVGSDDFLAYPRAVCVRPRRRAGSYDIHERCVEPYIEFTPPNDSTQRSTHAQVVVLQNTARIRRIPLDDSALIGHGKYAVRVCFEQHQRIELLPRPAHA